MVESETAEAVAKGNGVPPDVPSADTASARSTEPVPEAATTDQGGQRPPVVAVPPSTDTPATADGDGQKRRRVARPRALVSLAVLGVLAALSIIGGLVFGDSALGKTCVIGLVPAFSIAIGVVVTHWYSERGLSEQLASAVQNATYTTLHLKRSVQYVDERLELARECLENSDGLGALIEVVQAKTATHLSFGTAQQSSRQWEAISESGARAAQALFVEDDGEMRTPPLIREGNNPKTVALSEETATSGDDDK